MTWVKSGIDSGFKATGSEKASLWVGAGGLARWVLSPTRLAMSTPVTRCSRTSWIWGLSPGAMAVRITVSAFT